MPTLHLLATPAFDLSNDLSTTFPHPHFGVPSGGCTSEQTALCESGSQTSVCTGQSLSSPAQSVKRITWSSTQNPRHRVNRGRCRSCCLPFPPLHTRPSNCSPPSNQSTAVTRKGLLFRDSKAVSYLSPMPRRSLSLPSSSSLFFPLLPPYLKGAMYVCMYAQSHVNMCMCVYAVDVT